MSQTVTGRALQVTGHETAKLRGPRRIKQLQVSFRLLQIISVSKKMETALNGARNGQFTPRTPWRTKRELSVRLAVTFTLLTKLLIH